MKFNRKSVSDDLLRFISDGTPDFVIERYASLTTIAEKEDFGPYDEDIVIIDTETTGFSFYHDELIQIAAARMSHGVITERFNTFVNPGKPIPDEITHLTHITDDDVKDAPIPSEALESLVSFVGDSRIVAHNVEFDRTFTTHLPSGYPLLDNVWLDSLDLARITIPRMRSHRLIDLVIAFGAPLSTHRADDDVAATCALFRILLAAVSVMPASLIETIASFATVKQWPTVEIFKYFAMRTQSKSRDGADPFSLKSLRKRNISSNVSHIKKDADEVIKDPQETLSFPSLESINKAFSKNGIVGKSHHDFEARDEQRIMAEAVGKAFMTSTNLVVEAGTGVGKSLAYLVPAGLAAYKNDITVGVATKTNALLDQLIYHELPQLANAIGTHQKPLVYVSLKGFSHYPCLYRIERLVDEGPIMKLVNQKEYAQAPHLATVLSFIEQTDYDDLDGLKIDYRVLPRTSITTTSHECLRKRCPFYGQFCFVFGSRRKAECAHIVVTNHSLLFCDLSADHNLLPPIRYWIVDEAHGAEKEARRSFSLTLESEALRQMMRRIGQSTDNKSVFARAERTVGSKTTNSTQATTLFYGLIKKARNSGDNFYALADEFIQQLRELLVFGTTPRSKNYETVEIWINDEVRSSKAFGKIVSIGRVMKDVGEKLIGICQELAAYLEEDVDAVGVQQEIAAIALDLKDTVKTIDVILLQPSEAYVYAATLTRRSVRHFDKLEAMPFNVGSILDEEFYSQTHCVVYTSATLTVNHSFKAFEDSMGLGISENSQDATLALDSSYDYDRQMTIYVAKDIPEPNDPSYLEALQNLLIGIHKAQGGSILTLFTNRREMEKSFDAVYPALKEEDLRLVCQKWGTSIKRLRDDFIADEHLSLFALKSFWEGFDAPGATLKGVVIPKLPFAKPTDPLSCERAERDNQAWRKYVLPAAVLETKQAAGRLIRKANDEGFLVLADRRVVGKNYGRTFLRSMPSQNIKVCTMDEIIQAIAER